MKKIVSLLAVLALVCALIVPAAAAPADTPSISREDLETIVDEDVPLANLEFYAAIVVTVGKTGEVTTYLPAESAVVEAAKTYASKITAANVGGFYVDSIFMDPDFAEKVETVVGDTTSKVVVTLPADVNTSFVYEEDISLVVISNAGIITVPNSAFCSLLNKAGSSAVTIAITRHASGTAWELLSGRDGITQDQVAEAVVTEVAVSANGSQISSFDGETVSVLVPVDGSAYEIAELYKAYHVGGNGVVSRPTAECTYIGTELVGMTVNNLGTFAVLPEVVESSADEGENSLSVDEPVVTSPQTGEAAMSPAVAVLAAVSGLAAVALFFAAQKKNQTF